MWVSLSTSAPRVLLRRIILSFTSIILVAIFAVGLPLSQPVYAADASWDGNNIRYNSQLYVPEATSPVSSNDQRGMPGRIAYTWIETLSNGSQKAHTIFLEQGFERTTEISGSAISYNYRPPGTYSNPSSTRAITIAADIGATPSSDDDLPSECHADVFDSLGWALCSISRFISSGVDKVYGLIRDFLEVPAVTTDRETGLYTVWGMVRTIANLCFMIAIIAIVYSHITNVGLSNYGIKAMLPRLIIAAVLVNASFWIAALAVDISNAFGHSVHAIFENVRNNLPENVNVDWSGLTVFIMSAGTVTGALAFTAAVGGSFTGLGFLLLSALLTVAFGVFIAFVILAARQAILTILIVISPLAFVAYILPSTQNLFTKWRKSFTTLLLFFPLFGLLFGGSSLAGSIIMNNADGRLHVVLIGLTVQFVPLVLTPLLMQFSTGLLGRIAGMANTQRGAIDRARGWTRSNADYHRDKALGQKGVRNPFKKLAQGMDRGNRARENRREAYKSNAEIMARGYRDKETGEWRDRRGWVRSDIARRQAADQLKHLQDRGDTQYTEFTAHRSGDDDAVNPYKTDEGFIRSRASGARIGKWQPVKLTDEMIESERDVGYEAARDIAINAIRQEQAAQTRSNKINEELKLSAELKKTAAGIGNYDVMLAGVVTKERKEYGEQVAAQDQLAKHFNLNSDQWQNLAVGKKSVTVNKDGLVHKFNIKNDYVREAAIEHQMVAGSAGQIRQIINESGAEVHEFKADGTINVRPGKNFDFRSTIESAVISNVIAKKLPYVNDKSFGQILEGEWKGETSEYANALRAIIEGRLKTDSLVEASDAGLDIIYKLGDLKSSSNARDRGKFDHFKQMVLNMIPDPRERSDLASRFDTLFDDKYADIQDIAHQIMSNSMISQRASAASREVFEKYKKPK